jgi:hypothetical protein
MIKQSHVTVTGKTKKDMVTKRVKRIAHTQKKERPTCGLKKIL